MPSIFLPHILQRGTEQSWPRRNEHGPKHWVKCGYVFSYDPLVVLVFRDEIQSVEPQRLHWPKGFQKTTNLHVATLINGCVSVLASSLPILWAASCLIVLWLMGFSFVISLFFGEKPKR